MFQELDTDGDAFMNFPELSDTQLMDQLGQISTPEKSVTVEEISELLEQEYQRMLEEVHRETLFGEEVDDQFVGDSAPKEFEDDEEEPECWDPSLLDRTDYVPYPSKTVSLILAILLVFTYRLSGYVTRHHGQSSTLSVFDCKCPLSSILQNNWEHGMSPPSSCFARCSRDFNLPAVINPPRWFRTLEMSFT
jgi:hypothetical protein